MKKKALKSAVSLILVMAFVFSVGSGAFITAPVVEAASVYTNVKFTQPAICCNVGDTIDLTKCGVQFDAYSAMTKSGITWTKGGSKITSFKPASAGVTTLVAKSGSVSANVYVVAKNVTDTEYVLYKNDFSSAPSDFRVIETSNGGSAYHSGGTYVLDASNNASKTVRVLLPSFLDAFGDAKFEASVKITDAADGGSGASMMYRVQNQDIPYMQNFFRYEPWVGDGVEISENRSDGGWNVFRKRSFSFAYQNEFNHYEVVADGTVTRTFVNSYEVLTYGNTKYATGAFGFRSNGAKVIIDYVKITLDGNESEYHSSDVSFSKPAIATDIGQTVDLTKCDVQFEADAVYAKGSNITWKNGNTTITKFTPTEAGATKLTASWGGKTKNVYIVTRNLTDHEYIIYFNDFDENEEFRTIKDSSSSVYVENGNLILDASSRDGAYARADFPSYLDEFGDLKIEMSYYDTNQVNDGCWASLIVRAQNNDFPYLEMTIRKNTSLNNGVELSHRDENSVWNVLSRASCGDKNMNGYNTYSLVAQNNVMKGYVNTTEAVYTDKALFNSGSVGLMANGLKLTVGWFKVTLGETPVQDDTSVKCTVSKTRPAIGVNAGQTVLLSQCDVQFVYGEPAVSGKDVIWKKDGKVITEFSDTSLGIHWLTATNGSRTMNVAVVAKKSTDDHFTLYDSGFDSAPSDFRVIEQSNGGSAYHSGGTYVVDGSGNADAYVRVLLPAYLDAFGDITFEASVMLSNAKDSSKWGAMMYRVQRADYPYMQNCLRYNAAADSGMEITHRTESNEWNVLQRRSTGLHSPDRYNLWGVTTDKFNSKFYLNGSMELEYGSTPYENGAMGFHVRGLKMTIDWARVIFYGNNTRESIHVLTGNYINVRDPETGIRIAPAIITDIKTKSDLENIATNNPAIAMLKYDIVNGEAKVVLSDGTVTPDYALDKLIGNVIPAFRIDSDDDADSLANFLRGRNHKDAFAVSTTPSVVKRAFENWKYIRGVVDYSSRTTFDAESIRYEALANGARVLILPESTSKAVITQLQDSYSAVWLHASAGKTASVTATNKGPYGIITPDRAVLEQCYKQFYKENTMVRRPNVIGHRGNPSTDQENTIAGASTAYNYGATMVENDIYKVADGVLMVMHDGSIDRTTNGTGGIMDKTSGELKNYVVDSLGGVAAQPIPSLEDYFKLVKGDKSKKLVVEIKHPNTDFAGTLADLIRKYDIVDQIVIISFDANNLMAIRQHFPGIGVGYLGGDAALNEGDPAHTTEWILEIIQNFNCTYNPGYGGLGYNCIRELTYRGVNFWPWTFRDQGDFDRLMIEGVGGLTTDYCQWSSDYIENLTINANGRVIATTYSGKTTDVSNAVEFVVVEDTLGISYSNGVVNVPRPASGGKASYFFRYRSTNPSGTVYHTVTEVKTVEVAPTVTSVFELKAGSSLKLQNGVVSKITPDHTVATVKAQFKYPVTITAANGTVLADSAHVPTGAVIYLTSDKTKKATALMKGDVDGDGYVDSTDYARIKKYFVEQFNITGIYYKASDIDEDGTISSTDYVRLKSYFVGQFNIYA